MSCRELIRLHLTGRIRLRLCKPFRILKERNAATINRGISFRQLVDVVEADYLRSAENPAENGSEANARVIPAITAVVVIGVLPISLVIAL